MLFNQSNSGGQGFIIMQAHTVTYLSLSCSDSHTRNNLIVNYSSNACMLR